MQGDAMPAALVEGRGARSWPAGHSMDTWREQGWLCRHQHVALAELQQLCEVQLFLPLHVGRICGAPLL